MPRHLRIRCRNRYASEELILNAHPKNLWFDRRETDRPNVTPQMRAVVHISPKTARALAHWILEVYPE